MDIQFILDVYACAVYITNYISKAQKGMSELLRQACTEARKANSTINQQVRDIGSKFLNNVEISVLQLPIRKASRQVVFINTSTPTDRINVLKPLSDIKEMDDDCEDSYTGNLIKRYTKRPVSLEHLTLADWAAWYDTDAKPYNKQSKELDTDSFLLETATNELNDDDYNDDDDDDDAHSKQKTSKKNKRRKKARIIRSVWFNKETEPEKHYHELIMLFTSWRNEDTDLLGNCSSYQDYFSLMAHKINEKIKEYSVCNVDFNEIQEHANNMEDMDNQYDMLAPSTQNVECQDEAEGNQDLQPDLNENYNLSDDIGIPSVDLNHEPLLLYEMQDDDYRHMIQTLNKEQKEFFYHVLHLIKTSDEPFHCFLSGGAGVGKSVVTKALYQAALKYYNQRAGIDFRQVKVLLLAPTGKAANNIKGNTIHTALGIFAFHPENVQMP